MLPVFLFVAIAGAFSATARAAGPPEIRLVGVAEGLPSARITALTATPDGDFWVGTGDAGLFLFSPSKGILKRYRTADGLSSDEVTSVALFQGKVWAGTSAGLSVLEGKSWKTVEKADIVVLKNVRLQAAPDGKSLWACAVDITGGIARFDGKSWKFMGGQGRGLFNDVQGFAFVPEGVVMVGGQGNAYLHKGDDVTVLDKGYPQAHGFAAGVRDGKPVAATAAGLYELERGEWRPVPLPEGFEGKPVFSVASRGEVVYAGARSGLLRSAGNETRAIREANGVPVARVTSLAVSNDIVAAGTSNGLLLVRGW